jgi:glycosyltransferase involved in cell wall biosynthesis
MPAYQHEQFIEEAIKSVWNQSYRPLEFLVCDDCSSDSTYEVASELSRTSPIPMRIFRNSVNLGISKTLNSLLEKSSGKWIALLPSDDFYAESFIARNVEAVKELDSELVCVHSPAHRVNEHSALIDYQSAFSKPPILGDAFWQLADGDGQIVAPTFFTSRLVYERAGGFDENLRAEDLDLHLRTARFAKYHYIDEELLFKRESTSSLGQQTSWTKDIFVALSKHRDLDERRINALIDGRYPRHARRCGVLGDSAVARDLAAEYRARTGRTALPIWLEFATGCSIRLVRRIIGPGTASRVINRLRRMPRVGT